MTRLKYWKPLTRYVLSHKVHLKSIEQTQQIELFKSATAVLQETMQNRAHILQLDEAKSISYTKSWKDRCRVDLLPSKMQRLVTPGVSSPRDARY